MRRLSNRGRNFFVTIVVAMGLINSTAAFALSCIDIPGARIDTGLDALVPYQSFGRLIPEFKARTTRKQQHDQHTLNRLTGKLFVLPDDEGYVLVRPEEKGGVSASALISGQKIGDRSADAATGMPDEKHQPTLFKVLSKYNIDPTFFKSPEYPADLNPAVLVGFSGPVRVGQTTQQLRASDLSENTQTVKYACSSDAEFAGDPEKLRSFVVLKGTIRSTATTTTTVTERNLSLTINDDIELIEIERADLADLLQGLPAIAAALRPGEPIGAAKAIETSRLTDNTDATPPPLPRSKSEAGLAIAADTGTGVQTFSPGTGNENTGLRSLAQPQASSSGNWWPTVLSLLAGIVAVVLGMFALTRLNPGERLAREDDEQEHTSSAQIAKVAAPVANDNSDDHEQPTESEPSVVRHSASGLQARIDVLDTLQKETGQFQLQLSQTLRAAAADCAETALAKQEMVALSENLMTLKESNHNLQERADKYQAELSDTKEQALSLKQKTADLGVKLAKATTIATTSSAIISELESASETAISLNAEYRDKARAMEADAIAVRSQLEAAEHGRVKGETLLESTLQTNEDLDRALSQERAERTRLMDQVKLLEQRYDDALKATSSDIDNLTAKQQAASELARQLKSQGDAQNEQIAATIQERKQAENEAKTLRHDGVRMKMNFSVRAKLLEDNITSLGSYIDELEQLLKKHSINVPKYLDIASKFESSPKARNPAPQIDEKIVQFSQSNRETG